MVLFFLIIREAYTRAKETCILQYFTFFKFKILRVPEYSAVVSPAIIGYKGIISFNDKLVNIKPFDVGGIWPAPFLICRQINMIIIWAGESKPISEKGRQHVPIFFLISGVNTFNDFLVSQLVTSVGTVAVEQKQRNRK